MKKCRDCERSKLLEYFAKSNTCTDGYRPECKECYNNRSREQYRANRIAVLAKNKQYRADNREKCLDTSRRYYASNKQKVIARTRAYQKQHPVKVAEHGKRYRTKNKGKVAARDRKRKLGKINRTPKWLTSLQLDHIRLFYEAAHLMTTQTNVKFEVDHIVPLQGRLVSGLHVPWNLQVLPKTENQIKSNKTE